MLDINATRICPSQITDKFFVSRRNLKRISFEELEENFGFELQTCCREFLGIFLVLLGVNKRPGLHQVSSGEHFSIGVFSPRRIDSRIFGIESRYNVSWIASQSSIETRTPAFFLPTMWIGSWDFSDSARSFAIFAFVAVTVFISFILHPIGSVTNILL